MYDMTIRLQQNSDRCLYEQIYDYIRQEIREGRLLAGERLPSTRSLAEYLQVARSTVDFAYGQLLSEGYIESRPYKGYFVCPLDNLFQMEGKPETAVKPEAVVSRDKASEEKLLYDFSPNGIDMSGFPFGVWKRITKNVLNEGNSELFSQGEAQGDYDLRLTISRYLHSSRGVNCSPEQIVVGAGNDYLLMLLEKILGEKVHIAMENPTYKRAYRIFKSFGYEICTVDMDESGMKVSGLKKAQVDAAYVMPSHQYPTGVVMPIGRRTELLHWADGEDSRYLIEDDYDSEFRYRGKPIPSLQASDKRGKVIYVGTFSKAIAPAIRVSYMVLPPKLLERYHKECYFYSCTVSRIDQRILNEFIRDGYFERHLNKMRKIYRGKHEQLLECLGPFETDFKVSGEHAGLHLLLTAKEGRTETDLINSAAAQGVRVYGLSSAMVETAKEKQDGENTAGGNAGVGMENAGATILLGFGGLSCEEIIAGTERLKKAWL